jgi:hypothetical protein
MRECGELGRLERIISTKLDVLTIAGKKEEILVLRGFRSKAGKRRSRRMSDAIADAVGWLKSASLAIGGHTVDLLRRKAEIIMDFDTGADRGKFSHCALSRSRAGTAS